MAKTRGGKIKSSSRPGTRCVSVTRKSNCNDGCSLKDKEKQKQKAVLQHQKQMKNKNNGKKRKINKPRAIRANNANSNQDCTNCHAQYGSPDDEKAEEEWLECIKCNAWYHESCAELCGVLDDLYFTCQGCL